MRTLMICVSLCLATPALAWTPPSPTLDTRTKWEKQHYQQGSKIWELLKLRRSAGFKEEVLK